MTARLECDGCPIVVEVLDSERSLYHEPAGTRVRIDVRLPGWIATGQGALLCPKCRKAHFENQLMLDLDGNAP